jgi:hypothetical protein
MPEEEVVKPNGSKVKAWKDLTDGLFRKTMGAGIIFYSLYFIFGVAVKVEKDIKLMILTFIFSLISTIAGFYYGSSQPITHKEKENVEETE